MSKYELTTNTRNYYGTTLYQIQAVKDFGDVKAGDLGGWIEKESNLSQKGSCWIYDNAKALGNAEVSGEAKVSGYACISNDVRIFGHIQIKELEDRPKPKKPNKKLISKTKGKVYTTYLNNL